MCGWVARVVNQKTQEEKLPQQRVSQQCVVLAKFSVRWQLFLPLVARCGDDCERAVSEL
jgi:hypothetical protein